MTDELSKLHFAKKHRNIFLVIIITAFTPILIAAVVCVTMYLKFSTSTKKFYTGMNQSNQSLKEDATAHSEKLADIQLQINRLSLAIDTLNQQLQEVQNQLK